ncbi:MAG: hypothetical protein PWP65_625 [Clostridia bacterium]|nr:hypothetical protein [Clostridia bacterium]
MIGLVKLFEPGYIGRIKVRNRIVMPGIQTRGADAEGFITENLIDYYAERARGGAGLIIVQMSFAWPEARLKRGIGLWDDKFIPGLKKLAQAVQCYGARIAIQIGSRGTNQDEGVEEVAPSAVRASCREDVPRELTQEEITSYIEAFAEAARRVREAGFDAVEINGAHGHLISQFLSPYTNRRTDEYGGSVVNRTRFACEIIKRIRAKVGPDFPILIRMNGDDFIEGGITIEDAIEQARLFEAAGVDALDVSGGCHETSWYVMPSYFFPQGHRVHLALPIKKAVNIPVITGGKINDPVFAEQILAEGKADFVAIGRAQVADPEWANKAREGRFKDIRRCIYCCNCLTWERRPRLAERGFSCTVNPAVLREREFVIKRAPQPKKVMVVGGGLAGMEAARVLAERGHIVELYEKNDYLGGQWAIAAWPPTKPITRPSSLTLHGV